MVLWKTSTIFRRSIRSAMTPAHGPTTRNGIERIPDAIPTMKGDSEISHTTQGMVIIWNHTAEALHRLLSHSSKKSRWRRDVKVCSRAPRLGRGLRGVVAG